MTDPIDPTLDALIRLHIGLERLGPGTRESTERAYDLCRNIPVKPHILDLGCGAGAAARVLAERSGGQVTAIDREPRFLEPLRQMRNELPIEIVEGDMARPPVPGQSQDLVWSEGAIYFLGVAAGLRAWAPLLRPGGYLAFTQLCWIRADPPAEIRDYWNQEYPEMAPLEAHLATAHDQGWEVMGQFPLGPAAWQAYHRPLLANVDRLLAQHPGDPHLRGVGEATRKEAAFVQRFLEYFDYVFFVLRRPVESPPGIGPE